MREFWFFSWSRKFFLFSSFLFFCFFFLKDRSDNSFPWCFPKISGKSQNLMHCWYLETFFPFSDYMKFACSKPRLFLKACYTNLFMVAWLCRSLWKCWTNYHHQKFDQLVSKKKKKQKVWKYFHQANGLCYY